MLQLSAKVKLKSTLDCRCYNVKNVSASALLFGAYCTSPSSKKECLCSSPRLNESQKQTAPLRGLERKLHGKKETDSQTSLGGFPPGMASRAHPGRQISQYFATFLEQLWTNMKKPEMLQSVRCCNSAVANGHFGPCWTMCRIVCRAKNYSTSYKICQARLDNKTLHLQSSRLYSDCTVQNLQCKLYSELLNLQLRASSRVSITIGRRPSPALEHAIEGDNLTHHWRRAMLYEGFASCPKWWHRLACTDGNTSTEDSARAETGTGLSLDPADGPDPQRLIALNPSEALPSHHEGVDEAQVPVGQDSVLHLLLWSLSSCTLHFSVPNWSSLSLQP